MFTGIIEEIGTLRTTRVLGKGMHLSIAAKSVLQDIAIGDSIAVNGVCLTVTSFSGDCFSADAVEETMKKTTFGHFKIGNHLNLERALRAGGKIGGHYVQGHVDTISTLLSIQQRSDSWIMTFVLPTQYQGNVIPVGSITVDGVSLTVAEKGSGRFSVSIVPHTYMNTVMSLYTVGALVNLEFDVIGKYVQSFVEVSPRHSHVDQQRLKELGY